MSIESFLKLQIECRKKYCFYYLPEDRKSSVKIVDWLSLRCRCTNDSLTWQSISCSNWFCKAKVKFSTKNQKDNEVTQTSSRLIIQQIKNVFLLVAHSTTFQLFYAVSVSLIFLLFFLLLLLFFICYASFVRIIN